MFVRFAPFQILRPLQFVFGHPAEALEHTFREYDRNVGSVMNVSPYIRYLRNAEFGEERCEVYLVHHALDIRHTYLKRRVSVRSAVKIIYEVSIFRRYQAFTVEFRYVEVSDLFNALIPPHRSVAPVVFYGNVMSVTDGRYGIVYDYDFLFVPYPFILYTEAVRHDKSVVGVELGKLTFTDLHAERDTLFYRLIEILADERKPALSAHTR